MNRANKIPSGTLTRLANIKEIKIRKKLAPVCKKRLFLMSQAFFNEAKGCGIEGLFVTRNKKYQNKINEIIPRRKLANLDSLMGFLLNHLFQLRAKLKIG